MLVHGKFYASKSTISTSANNMGPNPRSKKSAYSYEILCCIKGLAQYESHYFDMI